MFPRRYFMAPVVAHSAEGRVQAAIAAPRACISTAVHRRLRACARMTAAAATGALVVRIEHCASVLVATRAGVRPPAAVGTDAVGRQHPRSASRHRGGSPAHRHHRRDGDRARLRYRRPSKRDDGDAVARRWREGVGVHAGLVDQGWHDQVAARRGYHRTRRLPPGQRNRLRAGPHSSGKRRKECHW